jgi:hypothetical protein
MADNIDALNYGIDAGTFQRPLAELAETIGFKVQREGPRLFNPSFVAVDIYVMVRQALRELYDKTYAQLMKDNGIARDQ